MYETPKGDIHNVKKGPSACRRGPWFKAYLGGGSEVLLAPSRVSQFLAYLSIKSLPCYTAELAGVETCLPNIPAADLQLS